MKSIPMICVSFHCVVANNYRLKLILQDQQTKWQTSHALDPDEKYSIIKIVGGAYDMWEQ